MRCNHCNLTAIKREADQLGKSVTLVEGAFGSNVHVHTPGESLNEDNWWAVFVHLPDHCGCEDLRWTTLKPARLRTYVPRDEISKIVS